MTVKIFTKLKSTKNSSIYCAILTINVKKCKKKQKKLIIKSIKTLLLERH
ncbi:MAG: hypothetical protein ACLRZ9_11050 [Eubacterium sp.]